MHNKIYQSKILVTGGAGFIGSHLVEALLPCQPDKIIILDNLSRGSYDNMQSFIDDERVYFLKGDITNPDTLEEAVKGVDYVFHMAALRINACAAQPSEGFEVMLKATFQLAELCVRYKVKKVIFSSSASIYGLAQHFPTPETDNPYNNQTFYGGAKLWGEQLFRSYKYMYDLDYVALRYFNVYGPRMDMEGKYTEVLVRWLDCIRDDRQPVIFGDGSTTMDLVHVKDVVQANLAALTYIVSDEVINVGNNEEISLRGLLETLLQVNKTSLRPLFLPENKVNPVSRRLADNTKAMDLLDFHPHYSLEEGMYELSQWYFENQKTEIPVL